VDFVKDQYRHGKSILVLGQSGQLLEASGVAALIAEGEPDPGVLLSDEEDADAAAIAFIEALGKHRHPERDPELRAAELLALEAER
jgi:catalase